MERLLQESSPSLNSTDDFTQLSLWDESTTPYPPSLHVSPLTYSTALLDIEPPKGERPMDRMIREGPAALSMAELLSLILKTGDGKPGRSALAFASHVLQIIQGDSDTFTARLRHLSVQELMEIPGIGPAKACAIVAAIELGKRALHPPATTMTVVDDPSIAAAALAADLMWEEQERFAVLFLDIKHRLIASKVIHIGSASETLAHPRDIFRETLRRGATRLIVAHNHPSGSLEPSPEDIKLTEQLLQGSRFMALPVLDHLILGQGNYISLRQTTSLWHTYPQDE